MLIAILVPITLTLPDVQARPESSGKVGCISRLISFRVRSGCALPFLLLSQFFE